MDNAAGIINRVYKFMFESQGNNVPHMLFCGDGNSRAWEDHIGRRLGGKTSCPGSVNRVVGEENTDKYAVYVDIPSVTQQIRYRDEAGTEFSVCQTIQDARLQAGNIDLSTCQNLDP